MGTVSVHNKSFIMKAEECVRILGCLTKSPYLVKWIDIDKYHASVIMKVGDLETNILVNTYISKDGPSVKVHFSNGVSSNIELASDAVADLLYKKCIELRDIVSDYSETVLLNSCCENNMDRTDNYPLK